MSFSGIAVEQRSKEAKALKFVLAYSLIGSLGLHIAVLAVLSLWTDNALTRVPNRELQPIDIVIVDSTTPLESKPPLEKKESELGSVSSGNIHTGSARGSGTIALSGGRNRKTDVFRPDQPQNVSAQAPSPLRVIAQKQAQLATVPVQKLSDHLKTPSERVRPTRTTEATEKPQPARQPKPVEPESKAQISESSKPLKTSPHVVATQLESTPIQPVSRSKPAPNPQFNLGSASDSSPQAQGSKKLTQQLRRLGDSRASKGNAGNSADSGRIDGSKRSTFAVSSGRGVLQYAPTGIGTGSKSGSNERGNGERSAMESGNSNGRGNSSGDGNGRAACRECRIKYPESARRRGIEGKVDVAVDTDEKGHVTNLRLAHSSGDRDLDEETLRQARDWKLKPASGGRRGVAITTEYAIEGSRRHRELQERKRHRQQTQSPSTAPPATGDR